MHRKSRSQLTTAAITRGVEALDAERFVGELAAGREQDWLRMYLREISETAIDPLHNSK